MKKCAPAPKEIFTRDRTDTRPKSTGNEGLSYGVDSPSVMTSHQLRHAVAVQDEDPEADPLELARRVFEGFTDEEINTVKSIALDRSHWTSVEDETGR